MKNMRKLSICLILSFLTAFTAFGQADKSKAIKVKSKIESVTLYRGQALITRVFQLNDIDDMMEVVVSDLPNKIIAESLYAEGEGIDVRAVRYRTYEVGEEPEEEIKNLDIEIESNDKKVYKVKQMQHLLYKRIKYLEKLENFVSETAMKDLSRGVLNSAELEKLSQYIFTEQRKITEEQLEWKNQLLSLEKEISLLKRKRKKLSLSQTKRIREALIFLQKKSSQSAKVRLNYIVKGAGWSPSYNFRAEQGNPDIEIEFNGIIQQMTGENWENVNLNLSTASPNLTAKGPGLAPFNIKLKYTGKSSKANSAINRGMNNDIAQQYKSFSQRAQKASKKRSFSNTLNDEIKGSWEMNDAVIEKQLLELKANDVLIRNIKSELKMSVDGPSISYDLNSRVSIASRSDLQMVRINKFKLPSENYYVATPILTSYIYREALVKNTSGEALLAGPVDTYLNGNFLGRGEVPTVAQGQKFTVGLGADSQLRSKRELVKKEEKVQGGNKEISIHYRLVIDNFKKNEAQIRLYDRLPFPKQSNDIRVTLVNSNVELSKDKIYLRLERPKGILRWDINVAGESTGEKSKIIDYQYKMEYDRNYQITIPRDKEKQNLQKDFLELEKERTLY